MKVQVFNKIRNCSKVGFHGWYNGSVGIIRKENSKILFSTPLDNKVPIEEKKKKWWKRLLLWLKKFIHRLGA